MPRMPNLPELEAIARLFEIAKSDTGQSRRVANFLLAWNNAGANGGWDPADLWNLDHEIADDIVTVVRLIRELPRGKYPNDCGFAPEIARVWEFWRGKRKRSRTDAKNA